MIRMGQKVLPQATGWMDALGGKAAAVWKHSIARSIMRVPRRWVHPHCLIARFARTSLLDLAPTSVLAQYPCNWFNLFSAPGTEIRSSSPNVTTGRTRFVTSKVIKGMENPDCFSQVIKKTHQSRHAPWRK